MLARAAAAAAAGLTGLSQTVLLFRAPLLGDTYEGTIAVGSSRWIKHTAWAWYAPMNGGLCMLQDA